MRSLEHFQKEKKYLPTKKSVGDCVELLLSHGKIWGGSGDDCRRLLLLRDSRVAAG